MCTLQSSFFSRFRPRGAALQQGPFWAQGLGKMCFGAFRAYGLGLAANEQAHLEPPPPPGLKRTRARAARHRRNTFNAHGPPFHCVPDAGTGKQAGTQRRQLGSGFGVAGERLGSGWGAASRVGDSGALTMAAEMRATMTLSRGDESSGNCRHW